MRHKILILAALALALTASAQTPDLRKPTPKIDWALLAADAGARSLDVYSTRRGLANGGHEMFLPGFIYRNTISMASYSAAVVAVDWFATRRIERKHPRLARVLLGVEIGQDGFWAARNLYVVKKTK